MNRLLHSPIGLLVRRIALLYIVLLLCRILFYATTTLRCSGPLAWTDAGTLLRGRRCCSTRHLSPMPTACSSCSRCYRCRHASARLVAVAALRLQRGGERRARRGDEPRRRGSASVTRRKRFTADEILFADNDNSFALVLKFAAEDWYPVLAAVLLTALLARGYGRRLRRRPCCAGGGAATSARRCCSCWAQGSASPACGATSRTHASSRSPTPRSTPRTTPGRDLIPEQPLLHPAHRGETERGSRRSTSRRAACTALHPRARAADSAAVGLTGRNIVLSSSRHVGPSTRPRLC